MFPLAKRLACILGLCLTLGLGNAWAAAPVKVVATFSILGDMVKQVGGEDVSVKSLVPPGGDAHVYQPSPGDAKELAAARLVVVNGLGLEGWMDRLIKASGTGAPIVVASRGIKPQTLREPDKGTGGTAAAVIDPHAWQNLANGKIYAANIAEALAEMDRPHAAAYRRRAEAYIKQLDDLDVWVRDGISQVPPAKRKIITSHDAFGYFGRAYGVTFLAPEGISTDSEPTAAGLAQLSRQIKKEHIKALFIENMSDPRLIQTLARDDGAAVGGILYSDSLSKPGGPADTYITMFRHNVPAMVAAMQKN